MIFFAKFKFFENRVDYFLAAVDVECQRGKSVSGLQHNHTFSTFYSFVPVPSSLSEVGHRRSMHHFSPALDVSPVL